MQFLDKVGDLPVAPVETPQVQFLDEVMVQTVIETIEIPQWRFDMVVDAPFLQVVLTVTCTVFGVRLRRTS